MTGYSGVVVRRISYVDVKAEPELLAAYAAECSIPALGPINPQWQTYARLEEAGLFQAFGAYSDGGMIGFATVLTNVLPHYGVRVAVVESVFVAKAWRKGGAGTKLRKAVAEYALWVDCVAILTSAPAGGQLEAVLGKRNQRTGSLFCEALRA